MAKQQRQKDPRKVAAGKARAAKAVRIGGKFLTNKFAEELSQDAAAVGFSGDLQTFLDQNEFQYSSLYGAEMRSSTAKADSTVFKEAKDKHIIIRRNGVDKEVTLDELKYQMLRVEQMLMANEACAGISFYPIVTLSGKYIIELPTLKSLEDARELDSDSFADLLERSEGMTVYISSKKRDTERNEEANTLIEANHKRKKKAVNKKLKNARATRKAKTGTKPRRR